MTCDHGRETVVRTGRPRKRGSPAPASAIRPIGSPSRARLGGSPGLNRRPYGRGHGDKSTATPVEMAEEPLIGRQHQQWRNPPSPDRVPAPIWD